MKMRPNKSRCRQGSLRKTICAGWLLALAVSAHAQRPEVYVQQGPDSVTCVAVSPDGRLLATGSRSVQSDVMRLYDLREGRELRTLRHFEVQALAFSPDGKSLISAGKEEKQVVEHNSFGDFLKYVYSIRLWDTATGAIIRTIATSDASFHDIALSPDGRLLAASSGNATRFFDVAGNVEPRALPGKSAALRLAFSPDSQTLAAETYEHAIKLWDVTTGAEKALLSGGTGSIYALRFGPDGKVLAAGSYDKKLRLWDAEKGTLLKTLSDPRTVEDIFFAQDGKTFLSVSSDEIRRWDVGTGDFQKLFKEPSSGLNMARFSPDGATLISVAYEEIIVSNVALGRAVHTFKKRGGNVCALWMLTDATSQGLVVEDFTRTNVWDYKAGEYRGMLNQTSFCNAGTGVLSPDLKLIAMGDQNGVALFNASDRRLARKIATGQSYLTTSNFAFSADSRLLAVGGMDGVTKVLNVSNGKVVTSINHNPPPKKIEVTAGVTVNDPSAMFPHVPARLAFSPDGKVLAGEISDKAFTELIVFWDATSGRELHRLAGHDEAATALAFSADGKRFASGDGRGVIKVWNANTGKEIFTLPGHKGSVGGLLFAPGNLLISGGADGRLRFWDLTNGTELVSLVSINGSDWLAVTPDGLFDGSPGAWSEVLWRFSPDVYDVAPVEIFFNEYFHPNLLPDILAGKRPAAATGIETKDRRQPQVKLALQKATAGGETNSSTTVSESRDVTIRVEVAEAPADAAHTNGSGVHDVRLFRNGALIKVWHGEIALRDGKTVLEATLPIVAGENRLSAYAFNRDNIKSGDAELEIAGAAPLKRSGVAYVLAIGVNEYENAQYNLKFAVADAQDFSDELKRAQLKVNNFARVEIIPLNNRDATKANILNSVADISAKIQPEDAIIIYFAGHGTAQQNRFYLIPHDLGYRGSRTELDSEGLAAILNHSISDEELEQALEGIDAGQTLLVIDACNSGQALEAEEKRRGPMNSKGLAQLAYEKGMYILTAAQSYQAANEAARLGHGYLTYALVEEGLKTMAADKAPTDGQVWLREWLDYATERVPQMQQQELDEQKKQNLAARIKFAESDSGDERSLQRPRVFYRRERETRPLVVARP